MEAKIIKINLESPLEESEEKIRFYTWLFKEDEKESLGFFSKIKQLKNLEGKKDVKKFGENYYYAGDLCSSPSEDFSKRLQVQYFWKWPKEALIKKSLSSIYNIIEDEGFSLGDKMLIKNIALKNLEKNLKLALEGENELGSISACFRIDRSTVAINELHNYGFKIKKCTFGRDKNQKIIYFDLGSS